MRAIRSTRAQVRRVERTAVALLGQMIKLDSPEHENDVHFLRWAVSLHEIGVSVAHSEFHKHGAYIVGTPTCRVFRKRDQARLALLVLGQRGKLQKLAAMPAGDPNWRLVFCLRLAVLLHRARDDHPLPGRRSGSRRWAFSSTCRRLAGGQSDHRRGADR
jgi:exopolyphosphatase/guanosine-5'-triphosphate,3'-diphosphate pyrophosphatase